VILSDTVSPAEIQKINWNDVNFKYPVDGDLIAKLNDGDSLIIRRKDFENYAREKFNVNPDGYEQLFTKMEIEPDYTGGREAWNAYMTSNVRYPKAAMDNKIEGIVILSFIVDTEGNVIEPEAIYGPSTGGLREEAVRIVKMSGR